MNLYLSLPETDLDHLLYVFASNEKQAKSKVSKMLGLSIEEVDDYGYQFIPVDNKVKELWNNEIVTDKELAKLNYF